MTDKPNLTRVWAKTAPGGNVVDPDTVTAGKFNAGWQAEVPPFEYFNFIQKQVTEGLAHINEQGIAVWDDVTTYPVGGLAKGSDGNVYKALVSQSDNDPVSDNGTNWVDELNNRVIRVTSTAAMEAYSAPVGYVFSLNAGGRSGTFDVIAGNFSSAISADPNRFIYIPLADDTTASAKAVKRRFADFYDIYAGIEGSTDSAAWQALIDILVFDGVKTLHITKDIQSLDGPVDCKDIRLICSDTIIPSSTYTLVNHAGIENGIIAGVNTSQSTLAPSLCFNETKNKFVEKDVIDGYVIYSAKSNPKEGYLRYVLRSGNTSTVNSLGGDAAVRISKMENLADCIFYKEEVYSSNNYTPTQGQPTSIGEGDDGGLDALFWDLPEDTGGGAGIIRFKTGSNSGRLDEISILFRSTTTSSDNIEIRVDANIIKENLSLVNEGGEPEYFIYRQKTQVPANTTIAIINRGTSPAYVAGINAYRPGEETPFKSSVAFGTFDRRAYSRYLSNYTRPVNGMADYALRRHPDGYSGDSPTGGSYHGGEVDISHALHLDDSYDMDKTGVGAFGIGKVILLVTNSKVVWEDGVSVPVQRILRFGDGSLNKLLRINGGNTLFDTVWTVMWISPVSFIGVRGLVEREISGVSSEFVCYDRANTAIQDWEGRFGVRNEWTLYTDERLSTGGPYIASEDGNRRKLYYGPILFNKGKIGTIYAQQITSFFGKTIQ